MAPPEIYRRQIPEDVLVDRRLGRHVVHDPKSRDYPAEKASRIVSIVHESAGLPLNQLQVGKCTCEALAAALNSKPNHTESGRVFTDRDTDQLYEVETELEGDPWSPAKPTVNDIGGSGLMVCRAAKQLGWLRLYRHAFGLDHALRATVLRPTIWGIDWYDGFDSPDIDGIVRIAGSVRGGHEICADEIDAERELVGFWQSWGPWGLRSTGRFYIPFADLGRLLEQQGDCTVPYV